MVIAKQVFPTPEKPLIYTTEGLVDAWARIIFISSFRPEKNLGSGGARNRSVLLTPMSADIDITFLITDDDFLSFSEDEADLSESEDAPFLPEEEPFISVLASAASRTTAIMTIMTVVMNQPELWI